MRDVERFCKFVKPFDDICYHFLVGGCGRIYEGRGWGKEGAHTSCYNYDPSGVASYGVAFIGNFSVSRPPDCMLNVYDKFIEVG